MGWGRRKKECDEPKIIILARVIWGVLIKDDLGELGGQDKERGNVLRVVLRRKFFPC